MTVMSKFNEKLLGGVGFISGCFFVLAVVYGFSLSQVCDDEDVQTEMIDPGPPIKADQWADYQYRKALVAQLMEHNYGRN